MSFDDGIIVLSKMFYDSCDWTSTVGLMIVMLIRNARAVGSTTRREGHGTVT